MRSDGRQPADLRPHTALRRFTRTAPGSVLVKFGGTTVLCTAAVEPKVPEWMIGRGTGWLTAEYNMLPSSTAPRKKRERDGKVDGRTTEIQRLIGRALRAIVDLDALGERTIVCDCEVLEADGGTRTTSINGAYLALCDALGAISSQLDPARPVLLDSIAAISVGIVDGRPLLDLNYVEDVAAAVDMNVVMTGRGKFVEIQGTGEEATFDDAELQALLTLAREGITKITAWQRSLLADTR
ncbi:MAG: ribonuclease PH [Pirellulales bacterium]|nr:ribonuclease PH [Pirellulales bacterium]